MRRRLPPPQITAPLPGQPLLRTRGALLLVKKRNERGKQVCYRALPGGEDKASAVLGGLSATSPLAAPPVNALLPSAPRSPRAPPPGTLLPGARGLGHPVLLAPHAGGHSQGTPRALLAFPCRGRPPQAPRWSPRRQQEGTEPRTPLHRGRSPCAGPRPGCGRGGRRWRPRSPRAPCRPPLSSSARRAAPPARP